MQHSKPLVSVIIPFYNRVDMTCKAVESVLTQTYQNFEILLVDDGSEEPLDQFRHYADRRLKIISQPNKGPSAARNTGIRSARGDFIAFLDSDDRFVPEKLSTQIEIHLNNSNIAFSHTNYIQYDVDDTMLRPVDNSSFSGRLYPQLFYKCPIHISTFMAHRSRFIDEYMFVERYRISEDIIFFSKFAKYGEILSIKLPLTKVSITETNHSRRPEAQIEGARNILDFLKNYQGFSGSEKRVVKAHLNANVAINYFYLRKYGRYIFGGLQAVLLAPFQSGFISRSLSLLQSAIRKRIK